MYFCRLRLGVSANQSDVFKSFAVYEQWAVCTDEDLCPGLRETLKHTSHVPHLGRMLVKFGFLAAEHQDWCIRSIARREFLQECKDERAL